MTFFYPGVLLLFAMQPLVLLASDTPAGPLIARGDRNFPPYEFINEDGEPDGFNIELLKAISRRLKMDVDIGLDAWETVRQDFTRGNIHLVTGMIRSAQREKLFDFSITHAGVSIASSYVKDHPSKPSMMPGGKRFSSMPRPTPMIGLSITISPTTSSRFHHPRRLYNGWPKAGTTARSSSASAP